MEKLLEPLTGLTPEELKAFTVVCEAATKMLALPTLHPMERGNLPCFPHASEPDPRTTRTTSAWVA